MIQFPGMYIVLRKQDPTAPAVGSIVNHFGLHVKSMADWLPKWEAAGLKIQHGNNPKQLLLFGPDEIKVEIIEDASIPAPVMMHHIHMYVSDPIATQAWYVKNFGAIAGKRNDNFSAILPGGEISIGKSDTELASTKGRLIDHIGFEVKDLDHFAKRLQASGIQVEAPGIRSSTNASKLRIAFITDPWGTYIELTEGLSPPQGH
jgi:extradiol dioxygenase family protein